MVEKEQGPRAKGRGRSQHAIPRLAAALGGPLGDCLLHGVPLSLGPRPSTLGPRKASAFTLIELIVVLAILSLLLMIAVPRYFAHVERTKETTLKQDLNVMRDAIDKFHADKGRYPESLEELTTLRYIRSVPVDPITDSVTTWKVIAPPDSETKGAVYDIKSGAEGNGLDGKPYADW